MYPELAERAIAMDKERYSSCCGCPDSAIDIDGPEYSDLGICPDCKEPCDFIEDEPEE
jgi:hypothetical protein